MVDKKDLNVTIGKNIRAERERTGYTREDLAELVDVTPRFIADIERGSVGVSIQTLKRICEVLGVSSDSIIWGENNRVSLDNTVRLLEDKYINMIDKLVRIQLEIINEVRHDNQ